MLKCKIHKKLLLFILINYFSNLSPFFHLLITQQFKICSEVVREGTNIKNHMLPSLNCFLYSWLNHHYLSLLTILSKNSHHLHKTYNNLTFKSLNLSAFRLLLQYCNRSITTLEIIMQHIDINLHLICLKYTTFIYCVYGSGQNAKYRYSKMKCFHLQNFLNKQVTLIQYNKKEIKLRSHNKNSNHYHHHTELLMIRFKNLLLKYEVLQDQTCHSCLPSF